MDTQIKTESQVEFELYMQKWVAELYSEFIESPEKRKKVFDTFDEALKKFRGKPKIVNYFENLRNAFLSLEMKN